jgi:hypothetical protein
MALGVGYIVLYFAKREEGRSRILGYFVSVFIIVLSAMIIIINTFLGIKANCAMSSYMARHKLMMKTGPMHQQQMPIVAPAKK